MEKINKVILSALLFLSVFSTMVFAEDLNIEIKTSKDKIKVGEELKVIVDWQQGMQAADFSLLYDNKKIEYINSDIEDVFVNNENNRVTISWFSDNNTDKTKMEFKFKAIEAGKVALRTKIEGGFATGELVQPNEYDEGNKTIEILESNGVASSKILIIILFIIFLIFIMNKKIKGGKRK